jgi:purine nucleoside permease
VNVAHRRVARRGALGTLLIVLLLLAGTALLGPAQAAGVGGVGSSGLRTLIVGTFPGEIAPLLAAHPGYRTLPPTPAEFAPIYCWDSLGRCATITGTTQANSGPGMLALALDPRLRLTQHTLFVPVGIAGGNRLMTLGDVGMLAWLTNTGLGSTFVDRSDAPTESGGDPRTAGWRTFQAYPDAARQANPTLIARAFAIAKTVKLYDTDAARAERAHYPITRAPKTLVCTGRGNDEFWVGAKRSAKEDGVAQRRVGEHDPRFVIGCGTSAFEDMPIVEVLDRFGWFDQTVYLRSVSDLESQRPGETELDQYQRVAIDGQFAGYEAANVNHSRVAWALADQLRL